MKTVLVLGAGSVSGPCVDYLLRKGNCRVVVADLSAANLAKLSKQCPQAETNCCDISRDADKLMDKYHPEVVINLMPPALMFGIGQICLEKGIHQIHPAYLDDGTRKLNSSCREKGVIFITELGIDPGIDHMCAVQKIKQVLNSGGAVESYHSYCGALPAAESNTNPWGYKLSWSPESLIGASKRTARILNDNVEIYWPDGETYEYTKLYDVSGLGVFEVYANGDSLPYKDLYGIPDAKSIYRGTIRYPGWGETICYMNSLGFFETAKQDLTRMTFADFTRRQAGGSGDAKSALCDALNLKQWAAFILRMEWLGFFDDRPLPFETGSARDVVSLLFGEKLMFTPTERDLIILCDEMVVSYAGGKREKHCSTLIDYGVPGKWSSIAKTTGTPPAIAARLIMEGAIKTPGVHIPILPEIYEPILEELKIEGIELEENIVDLP